MTKILLIIMATLVLCSCGATTSTTTSSNRQVLSISGYPSKPDLVVYEYCKADAYGSRLTSDTAELTSRYYSVNSPPELGWNYIYLIRDYKIQQTIEKGDTATVYVIYDYMATLNVDKADVYVEDMPFLVEFNLVKERGLWKIAAFKTLPCVYKETALAYLKERFKGAGNQKQEDEMLSLIQKVKTLE
ncbi:MAG: hypothetical protein PHV60_07130 [bacterium]|nr:hypothetical protein [bacterium]